MEGPICLAVDTTENWKTSKTALGESELAIEIETLPDGTKAKRLLVGTGSVETDIERLRAKPDFIKSLPATLDAMKSEQAQALKEASQALADTKQDKITATGATNLLTAPPATGGQPGTKPVSEFVLKSEVADHLTSQSKDTPLSAAQGRALAEGIKEQAEELARTNTALQGNIDDEARIRQQEDSRLAQALTQAAGDEAQARQHGDDSLMQAITQAAGDEAQARQQADENLQRQIELLMPEGLEGFPEYFANIKETIEAEEQLREQGDNDLAQALTQAAGDEAQARQQADSLLAQAIAGIKEFTFIIDSDQKLADWANNVAGNDYSRVLIKAGTWALNTFLTGGTESSPLAIIDMTLTGTKCVVGESGSQIVLNNTRSDNPAMSSIAGLKGSLTGTYPNFNNLSKDFFCQNVKITLTLSGSGGCGYSFFRCADLTSCEGTGTGAGIKSGLPDGLGGFGFANCANLTNCNGNGVDGNGAGGYGFANCTKLTNCTGSGNGSGSAGYGFYNCANLTSCEGTGTSSGTASIGFYCCTNLFNCKGIGQAVGGGYGFSACRTGFGCTRKGQSMTGTFISCYMEQSSGSTPWDNTAAGGYNLP